MKPAGFLLIEGRDHALERIEDEGLGLLRLTGVQALPRLRNRVMYQLTRGATREPVRESALPDGRTVRVRRMYL